MGKNQYRVLLCKISTGQVLNLDAVTLFSGNELPYSYFDSLAEAEFHANDLAERFKNLEIVIYSNDDFIKQVCSK